MNKQLVRFFVIALFLFAVCTRFAGTIHAEGFWQIQSIDTMKFSRDISREPDILSRIPKFVDKVASLHPTHIAVATPYDEEFYPVLKKWVDEARSHNLKIWFRGNFSSWEGWFGYPKFKDYKEHHTKTYAFITKHPELFAAGDIFTPAPEPENGGLGDPRGSKEKTVLFQQFLVDSYNSCSQAMSKIGVEVKCGYFSTNGDVARESLTPDVVKQIGGVVVIDHFVKTPQKLAADILSLAKKYNAKIVLGEVGAPIPDIHGKMTEFEQASYIQDTLSEVLKLGDTVEGINYWTAFGGSTLLFDEKTMDPRRVADVVSSFFAPPELTGVITDQFGLRIQNAKISALSGSMVRYSQKDGQYKLPLPGKLTTVTIDAGNQYRPYSFDLGISKDIEVKNIVVTRKTNSILDPIVYMFIGFIQKIASIFGA